MSTECRECKGTVSSEAKSCPHCGTPVADATSDAVAAASPATKSKSKLSDRLTLLAVALIVAGAAAWFLLPPSGREGAGRAFRNIVRAEQTVTDETFDVSAGTYRRMSFRLRKEAKVTVRLAVRDGAAVDLYLMDSQQGREFDQATQKLFGAEFPYKQALSRQSVREYVEAAVLPLGEWHFVIRSTDPPPLMGKGRSSRVYLKVAVQG